MINRITGLRQMVGARYLMPVGTGYFPVAIVDVFDHFEAEFGKTLVEVVPYDSALKIDSLLIEELEACLQEVKAQYGSTWCIYSDLV